MKVLTVTILVTLASGTMALSTFCPFVDCSARPCAQYRRDSFGCVLPTCECDAGFPTCPVHNCYYEYPRCGSFEKDRDGCVLPTCECNEGINTFCPRTRCHLLRINCREFKRDRNGCVLRSCVCDDYYYR